ncbi:adenosylcobinamide-GDP ribazoletransferase [Streptomyces sp. NPDC047000]|uniref:adenosylcobinamide-GDP ribazoletransferase n=1 Tax=Streptomyces sp. NPDC047000 TaxID=3155474 RepID=UPI0033F6D285
MPSPPRQPSRPSVPPLHGPRFAFGTLTVLPVTVHRWDRDAARGGMLSAPLAGLVVGGCAAVAGLLLLSLGSGGLLAAVGSVAVCALLTRGLHLDGLADTADGLGSAKPAEDALRIMKQSDIGPFGVITLLFALLAQVAALARVYDGSWAGGALAVVVAAVTSRAALTLAARDGVPAARPEGLGAAVAGVVPVRSAWAAAGTVALAAAAAGSGFGGFDAVRSGGAALLALGAGELLLRRCVRRFGGITGDVFGGVEETVFTVAVVVAALGR